MRDILDNYLFDAFANASDHIFIYAADMKRDLSRWSKSGVDYFGIEAEYLYNAKDMWLEHIHPDDRQIYLDDITAVFAGNAAHHNCQYRARNKYGEYVWLECRGSVLKDENGEPSIFAGIMTRLDNQNKYDALTHLLTAYELMRLPFDEQGALMLVGIDDFRNINSQHGILYGNKILVRLSEVLAENAQDAIVYRFQGAEFVLYGKNMTVDQMSDIFQKVSVICKDSEGEDASSHFSISAGIVKLEGDANASEMLGRAALSLAYAKNATSHMVIFSKEIEAEQNRKNKISEALLRSIKNGCEGFYLVYQPILDTDGERIVGCESLLRWNPNDEQIGACYPDEFIATLENNGGIIDVGYFVMRESIRQAAEWQKKYQKFNVSFNVSYLQLEDMKFIPSIIETAQKYQVDMTHIVVELTESVFAADTVMVRNSFELLKQHGIKIALDDFGTGNSSFWMLHNINIDIVKLDQSFIRGLDNSGTGIDFAIVESVGLLCNRIGCMTVAEGVENDTIWKMISKYEFTGLQGYLFSKPVPIEMFEELLEKYGMKL